MKTLNLLAKALHIVVFVCFFLPFFYAGCKETTPEKTECDTVTVPVVATDTTNQISVNTPETNTKSDSLVNNQTDNQNKLEKTEVDSTYVQKLATKNKVLKILLLPKDIIYTGIGYIIDLTAQSQIMFFSLPIAFIVLIIGLILRFIDNTAKYAQLVLQFFWYFFYIYYCQSFVE